MLVSSVSAAVVPSIANFIYASQSLSEISTRKKRILLVEDNPALQYLHSLWLKELGHEVIAIDSGEEALAEILSDYDAILMDLDLPGDDGIVTSQKLLKKNNIPIIACTSHTESEMKDACIAAGMVDYLQKPVSLNRLRQSLTTHLA